jgi:hypothetical protein
MGTRLGVLYEVEICCEAFVTNEAGLFIWLLSWL